MPILINSHELSEACAAAFNADRDKISQFLDRSNLATCLEFELDSGNNQIPQARDLLSLTVSGSDVTAKSNNLRNIRVNMPKLVEVATGLLIAIPSVNTAPWLFLPICIQAISGVTKLTAVKLSEEAASVAFALHQHAFSDNIPRKAPLLQIVNEYREKNNSGAIGAKSLLGAMAELKLCGYVKYTSPDCADWSISDIVRIRYT